VEAVITNFQQQTFLPTSVVIIIGAAAALAAAAAALLACCLLSQSLQHSDGYHYNCQHALQMHSACPSLFPAFDLFCVCVLSAAQLAVLARHMLPLHWHHLVVLAKAPRPQLYA
jgi:hypothetical protein